MMSSLSAFNKKTSFYRSLRPVVLVANLFGLLPISGAGHSHSASLSFRWYSIKVLYAAIVAAILWGACVFSVRSVLASLSANATAKDVTAVMSGFVFHQSAAFSVSFFIRLSRRLPALLRTWDDTAGRLLKYCDVSNAADDVVGGARKKRGGATVWPRKPRDDLHFPPRKMAAISLTLMSSAMLDRVLHDSRFTMSDLCPPPLANGSYALCYLHSNADYLVTLLEGRGHAWQWAGALSLLALNALTSLTWNFLDLFLILVSCGLHHHFRHINRYLASRGSAAGWRPEQWRILREDHLAVAELVSDVDDALSVGVLYSYAANLISICTQMFLGLRPRNSAALETTYTTISFLHLVGRTSAVTWAASRIHDEYQLPLKYIHACDSGSYCLETQRLRAHILETPACLSGCRFFFVTRSFFLGLVSVVITYEVIFLELK